MLMIHSRSPQETPLSSAQDIPVFKSVKIQEFQGEPEGPEDGGRDAGSTCRLREEQPVALL